VNERAFPLRRLACARVAILTASLLVDTGWAQVKPKAPVFSVELRIVVLQATVKNRAGQMVTDLKSDAFTVFEDGKRQPVTLFNREDVPVSLGIAIDNSGSMRLKREKVEAAALALVRASNPDDEVFVLNFGDKVRLDVPFTQDLALLERGVARVDSLGGTALRDAIEAGETYLDQHARHKRKALLVITDGMDNASTVGASDIRRHADRSEVTIHAIGLLSEEQPARAAKARHDLDDLTEATGGMVYFPSGLDEVSAVALDLAHQIRSQYTIAYTPLRQELDGSYRKLRVVAKGPGDLQVRARAGYLAAPQTNSP
jgi:VWFA-related protein